MSTYLEAQRAIRDHAVVSFDVFDTLLRRVCARPTDVFRIVQHLADQSGLPLVDDFEEIRIKAEQVAATGPRRWNYRLDDIYRELARLTGLPELVLDRLRDLEIAVERAVCRPRAVGRDLYGYAQRLGKRIVLASDMYLPPDVIAGLLAEAGYTGYERLIVSAFDCLAKHDGTAYAALSADYQAGDLVHIGDNDWADFQVARRHGLAAVRTPSADEVYGAGHGFSRRPHYPDRFGGSIQEAICTALVADAVADAALRELADRDPYLVGYRFGPTLLAFTNWLHARIADAGPGELFFLARDGAIMLDAYRLCYPQESSTAQYIFASRRLFNFPCLTPPLGNKDLDFLMSGRDLARTTAGQLLRRFGFDPRAHAEVLRQVGLDQDTPINTDERDGRMRALFQLIGDEVADGAAEERAVLMGYLDQVGLLRASHPTIIDIGWAGSLQLSLQALAGRDIQGLYFGRNDDWVPANLDFQGFISQSRLGRAELMAGESFIPFAEQFFTNLDEGTIEGVRLRDDGSYAALRTPRSGPSVDADRQTWQGLRRGAVDFVRDYLDATASLPDDLRVVPAAVGVGLLLDLYDEPGPLTARVIGGMHQFNGMGSEGADYRVLGSPSRATRISRRRLRREADRAIWRQGYDQHLAMMKRRI